MWAICVARRCRDRQTAYHQVSLPDVRWCPPRRPDATWHVASGGRLTSDELSHAPVLESLDVLLVEDLTDDEDDAFAAAIDA
jgi:hypothetical protein